jgi:hypothetical protein
VRLQQRDRVLRQHRAQAERHVGARHRLERRQRQHRRQPLAAMRRVRRDADPAGLGVGAESLGEARRHADRPVLPPRADLVADAVERREQAGRRPRRFLQHRLRVRLRHRVEAEHAMQQPGGLLGSDGDHGKGLSAKRVFYACRRVSDRMRVRRDRCGRAMN